MAKIFTTRTIVLSLVLLAAVWLILPTQALAQASLGIEVGANTGLGSRDLKDTIVLIIEVLLGFLGIAAVVVILYGGYIWMTAAGNEEKVEQGKKILVNAVIGLVVILAAFAVVMYVVNVIGAATSEGPATNINGAPGSGAPGDRPLGPGGLGTDENFGSKPDYCFNGRLDETEGETGLDCGGSCGLCDGDSCGQSDELSGACIATANELCASNFCDPQSCKCLPNPQISGLAPDNAAPGSWVTIFGTDFGQEPGRVMIGGQPANLPDDACSQVWSDNQIIMEVPQADLGNNQIQVITGDNLLSNFYDFLINDLERPGICGVSPLGGALNDTFTVSGVNFGAATDERLVYFGRPEQAIEAAGQLNWQTSGEVETVSGQVPNLAAGLSGLRVSVNGQDSNAVSFEVEAPDEQASYISYFTPEQGATGQYLTIYGNNFGEFDLNSSRVEFTPAAGTERIQGSFDFPEQCSTDFWHDDQIVVKVPDPEEAGFIGEGPLYVVMANGSTLTSDANFIFDENLSVTPGLCSLFPQAGLPGSTFDVAGENFTDARVNFNGLDLPAEAADDNLFNDVVVPAGAASGPVKVVRDGLFSNAIDFNVLTAEPEPEASFDYYQWQFTTCYDCLIPEVVEIGSCLSGLASPSPLKNSLNNFGDTLISATFNTSMNHDDFVLGESVVIKECGQQDNPQSCSSLAPTGTFNFGYNGSDFEYFQLQLNQALPASTWYQVTLNGLSSSSTVPDSGEIQHVPLAEPYRWYFKIREDDSRCQLTGVSVNPAQRIINSIDPQNHNPLELGDSLWYRASVYNADSCNICPGEFAWQWSSSNPSTARLDETSTINRSLLSAAGITSQTEIITAVATADSGDSFSGQALVDIVPVLPYVVLSNSCSDQQSPSPYLRSGGVCRNAKIAVRFNRSMDEQTLSDQNIIVSYGCDGGVCPVDGSLAITSDLQGQTNGFIFTPAQDLPAGQAINVELSDNILSADGAALTGLSQWSFTTRTGLGQCNFDTVYVYPGRRNLLIDESQSYTAEGYGAQVCQVLKTPPAVQWSWQSSNAQVASVEQTGLPQTTATSLTEGVTYIRAQGDGIVNQGLNGLLEVSSGSEPVDLTIVSHRPVGGQACLNTSGRLEFNLPLVSASVNQDNFAVYKSVAGGWERYSYCSDDAAINCLTDADCPGTAGYCRPSWNLSKNNSGAAVNILPVTENLLWSAETTYQIRLQGGLNGLATDNGKYLTSSGCQEGLSWDYNGEYCFWQFTTSDLVCEVNRVDIEPYSATSTVGTVQNWDAQAYSIADEALTDKIGFWSTSTVWSVAEPVGNIEVLVDDGHQARSQALGVGQMRVFAGAFKSADNVEVVWGNALLEVTEALTAPKIQSVRPKGNNICTNALVKLTFNKPLLPETVNNQSLKIGYLSQTDQGNCLPVSQLSYGTKTKINLFHKLFSWLNQRLPNPLTGLIKVKAASVNPGLPTDQGYFCPLSGNWSVVNSPAESQVSFNLLQAMPSNTDIRLIALAGTNGVKSRQGLGLAQNFYHTFKTRQGICALNSVGVVANQENGSPNWTFFTSFDDQADNSLAEGVEEITDADKFYYAYGLGLDGQLLSPLPEVYDWSWQWSSGDSSVADINLSQGAKALVKAKNNNGQAAITAAASFDNGAKITGSGYANVYICENPWPARTSTEVNRYVDNQFNFALYYCRDYGYDGPSDDLPALNTEDFVINNYVAQSNLQDDRDELIKEYLIPVPTTGDVIGLRVYENPYHLSVGDWYQKNLEFKGSTDVLTVDGYQAIADGRTTYVAVGNVGRYGCSQEGSGTDVGSFGDGNQQLDPLGQKPNFLVRLSNLFKKLFTKASAQDGGDCLEPVVSNVYTNIFLISYNQNAQASTEEIVSQLISYLKFNTNVSHRNIKAGLNRDVVRLGDLAAMAKALDSYRQDNNNRYPTLEAGTFIKGMSTSKWPSWNQSLAPVLGLGLPSDPINRFNACIDCQEPVLLNNSFELPWNNGWTAQGNVGSDLQLETNRDAQFVREGSGSLYVKASTAERGLNQNISLTSEVSYDMSAWVYVISGRVQLKSRNQTRGNEWLSPADHQGWIKLSNRLITGEGGDNLSNSFSLTSLGGPAEFYVDQAQLKSSGGNCGYDPQTCWNPEVNNAQGAFACDQESYLYKYQSLSGGGNYLLSAKLETTTSWLPANFIDVHLRLSTESVYGCNTEVTVVACGDGSVGFGEQCEPGMFYNLCDTKVSWNNLAGVGPYGCVEPPSANQCNWYQPLIDSASSCYGLDEAHCCGGYCGDGTLNTVAAGYNLTTDEQCDPSAPGGARGYGGGTSATDQYKCSSSCQDAGGYCGDGLLNESFEQCEGSATPGNWSCFGDNNTGRASCQSCRYNCAPGQVLYPGICGNNVIEGPEDCDTCLPGQEECNGLGEINGRQSRYECTDSCQWDITSGYCGDGQIQANLEYCDPAAIYASGVCEPTCRNLICQANYGNCNDQAIDGCEVNLLTDNNNCGVCGAACAFGGQCVNGRCQAGAPIN
jgi:hypothetical protein